MNPLIFGDFCDKEQKIEELDKVGLDLGTATCARLMEFIFLARKRLAEEVRIIEQRITPETAMHDASQISSLASSHIHIAGAIAMQRGECFTRQVRLLILVSLRRVKELMVQHFRALWETFEDGGSEESMKTVRVARTLFDTDIAALEQILQTWRQPTLHEGLFYALEVDGRFTTLEFLRRETFDEWPVDRGLLRVLLPIILNSEVGDFGAGSGSYSTWLNNTGLVTSYAYDGTEEVDILTEGRVKYANIVRPLVIPRRFDYCLLLDVGQFIPSSLFRGVLVNLRDYAKKGIIISWKDWNNGPSSPNPMTEKEFLELIEEALPSFTINQGFTDILRAGAEFGHFKNTTVFLTHRELEQSRGRNPLNPEAR